MYSEKDNQQVGPSTLSGDGSIFSVNTSNQFGNFTAIAVDKQGDRIAAATEDGSIFLFDLSTGTWDKVISTKSTISRISFSFMNNTWLYAAVDNGALHCYNIKTGALIITTTGHTSGIKSISQSPDGRVLLTSSSTSGLLWSTHTWRRISVLSSKAGIADAVIAANSGLLAVVFGDDTIHCWDRVSGDRLPSYQLQSLPENLGSGIRLLSVSPDGTYIAAVANEPCVYVWDVPSRSLRRIVDIPTPANRVVQMAIFSFPTTSPDATPNSTHSSRARTLLRNTNAAAADTSGVSSVPSGRISLEQKFPARERILDRSASLGSTEIGAPDGAPGRVVDASIASAAEDGANVLDSAHSSAYDGSRSGANTSISRSGAPSLFVLDDIGRIFVVELAEDQCFATLELEASQEQGQIASFSVSQDGTLLSVITDKGLLIAYDVQNAILIQQELDATYTSSSRATQEQAVSMHESRDNKSVVTEGSSARGGTRHELGGLPGQAPISGQFYPYPAPGAISAPGAPEGDKYSTPSSTISSTASLSPGTMASLVAQEYRQRSATPSTMASTISAAGSARVSPARSASIPSVIPSTAAADTTTIRKKDLAGVPGVTGVITVPSTAVGGPTPTAQAYPVLRLNVPLPASASSTTESLDANERQRSSSVTSMHSYRSTSTSSIVSLTQRALHHEDARLFRDGRPDTSTDRSISTTSYPNTSVYTTATSATTHSTQHLSYPSEPSQATSRTTSRTSHVTVSPIQYHRSPAPSLPPSLPSSAGNTPEHQPLSRDSASTKSASTGIQVLPWTSRGEAVETESAAAASTAPEFTAVGTVSPQGEMYTPERLGREWHEDSGIYSEDSIQAPATTQRSPIPVGVPVSAYPANIASSMLDSSLTEEIYDRIAAKMLEAVQNLPVFHEVKQMQLHKQLEHAQREQQVSARGTERESVSIDLKNQLKQELAQELREEMKQELQQLKAHQEAQAAFEPATATTTTTAAAPQEDYPPIQHTYPEVEPVSAPSTSTQLWGERLRSMESEESLPPSLHQDRIRAQEDELHAQKQHPRVRPVAEEVASSTSKPSETTSTPTFPFETPDAEHVQRSHRKLMYYHRLHKSFPDHHRPYAWMFLLRLPKNDVAWATLCTKVQSEAQFWRNLGAAASLQDPALRDSLYECLHAMHTLSPVLGTLPFLPGFLFPFVKYYLENLPEKRRALLAAFETSLTVLTNWGKEWTETLPHPPLPLLGRVHGLLHLYDRPLAMHLEALGTNPAEYAWPIFSTACSEVLPRQEWEQLWDWLFVQAHHPRLLDCVVVSYLRCIRSHFFRIQTPAQRAQGIPMPHAGNRWEQGYDPNVGPFASGPEYNATSSQYKASYLTAQHPGYSMAQADRVVSNKSSLRSKSKPEASAAAPEQQIQRGIEHLVRTPVPLCFQSLIQNARTMYNTTDWTNPALVGTWGLVAEEMAEKRARRMSPKAAIGDGVDLDNDDEVAEAPYLSSNGPIRVSSSSPRTSRESVDSSVNRSYYNKPPIRLGPASPLPVGSYPTDFSFPESVINLVRKEREKVLRAEQVRREQEERKKERHFTEQAQSLAAHVLFSQAQILNRFQQETATKSASEEGSDGGSFATETEPATNLATSYTAVPSYHAHAGLRTSSLGKTASAPFSSHEDAIGASTAAVDRNGPLRRDKSLLQQHPSWEFTGKPKSVTSAVSEHLPTIYNALKSQQNVIDSYSQMYLQQQKETADLLYKLTFKPKDAPNMDVLEALHGPTAASASQPLGGSGGVGTQATNTRAATSARAVQGGAETETYTAGYIAANVAAAAASAAATATVQAFAASGVPIEVDTFRRVFKNMDD